MSISNSLQGLKALVAAPPDHYTPNLETFPQPNTAEIERVQRVLERAKERGAANLPHANSNDPDPVEADLLGVMQHELLSSNSRYLDEQELYDERLQRLNFQGRFAFVNAAVAQAVADFRVEANFNSNISLVGHRKNLADATRELQLFRKQNRINHVARYPGAAVKTMQWGLIALLFLIEATVNGSFLRKGGGGWLGGISTAIAFAFVNILFSGIIANFGIRQLFHRNIVRKFIGLISLLLFLTLTTAINTVLAIYRELSLDISVSNIEEAVVARVKAALHEFPIHVAQLFAFQNIETYVLLLVGILFAIVVMIDVLKLDDLYPGYGDVDRRYHKHLDAYAEEVSYKIADLQALRDDAIGTLDQLKKDFAARLDEYEFILGRRRALYQKFKSHIAELQRALDAMIRSYRLQNTANRSTPAPTAFDRPVMLPSLAILEPVAKDVDLMALKGEFEKIVSVLTSQGSNLHEEFEKAAKDFRAVGASDSSWST